MLEGKGSGLFSRIALHLPSMGDESEFLIGGRWVPLSQAPRDWLEQEYLRALDQIHRMHAEREEVRGRIGRVLKELDVLASDVVLARKLGLTGLDRVLALAQGPETIQ